MAARKKSSTKETKTAVSEPSPDRETIYEGTDEAPRFYANNISVRASTYDIRLAFGEVMKATEDELHIRDKVVIYMSPQHAKAAAGILAQKVLEYEELHGRLPGKTTIELVKEEDEDN